MEYTDKEWLIDYEDCLSIYNIIYYILQTSHLLVNNEKTKIEEVVSKIDISTTIEHHEQMRLELENILQLTRDSLNAYKNDTIMSEDEFILRYKLERIRYYNELAGKGNNIKFIRGWINRVINE